jgi:signal transduction histidine kinase
MVARGLESFGRDNPSLATELRLPSWDQPTKLAWPPPKPSEAAAFAASMAVPMHRGADWWRDGAARAAEQAAEAKRVSDHYAEQARLRDEHEAAEERARIAKARR